MNMTILGIYDFLSTYLNKYTYLMQKLDTLLYYSI